MCMTNMAAKRRHVAYTRPLPASVGRPTTHHKPTEITMDKIPTLRKIKRAANRNTSQSFCSTFNFTQPHPKPTHHPYKWTVI